MPYITKQRQKELGGYDPDHPKTGGELNYLFTELAQQYLFYSGKSYETLNTILGAFDGAKAEFYRRVVVPYEENKIKENGDVY